MHTILCLALALATAMTILAPSLAMPPASYLRPTMKPVMFCRKSSGIFRCAQSWTKCAPVAASAPTQRLASAFNPTMCSSAWNSLQTTKKGHACIGHPSADDGHCLQA
jgi:hypothetical protein